MPLEDFPLSHVFHIFEGGPVVLVTTFDGVRSNVMALCWQTMLDFDPPLVGIVVAAGDYSQAALRKSRECVIAIPGADLIEKVVDAGNCSGRDTDKFAKFGLTPLPAEKVRAPLVGECLVNIECRVVDDSLADSYEMFVVEGVRAWNNPERIERRMFHSRGNGRFVIDGELRDLSKRMAKFKNMV
jgi:flavin reductase (DIM6/NTAB) family NADH-FMN oxidoreductase RutF